MGQSAGKIGKCNEFLIYLHSPYLATVWGMLFAYL